MGQPARIVHYVNQFFGGIGGEEKAHAPLEVREGPVGPGRALQQILGEQGTVVATLICGDDYVAEREDEAGAAIREVLGRHRPDLVLAGPAFDSGRYGLGCALTCRVAQSLGIPAVTGMYPDNAAIITHRRELLAVPTGLDASEMKPILARMVGLGLRLARGETLGSAAEEGYIPRGIRRLVMKDKVGYERAVDMLLAQVAGRPVASEIQVQQYDRVTPAPPVADLARATIGIVVSTGIVPRGNPDHLPGARALAAGRYSIDGLGSLDVTRWESAHGGFNTKILNTRSPDYALPLGTLRALEAEGAIGGIYPWIYSTVGNQTAVGPARAIGRRVAEEFRDAGVAAALQVSGWGSCHRCGATIAKELERVGIPTALIGALPAIALAANANRVVRGVQVQHPCGDPKLPEEADRDLSRRIVWAALSALQTPVTEPTLFDPPAAAPERVSAS